MVIDMKLNRLKCGRKTYPGSRSAGFTLIEVMIAIGIIAVVLIASVSTIQTARIRARSVGMNLIGQNLSAAMMELIKRSGYMEISYNQTLPGILVTANTINPLLDFPRQLGSSTGASSLSIPAGAPGGVSNTTMDVFLSDYHSGSADRESTVITSGTNYLFFSPDQIAAMNGYDDSASVPQGTNLLDPQFAWSVYIKVDPAGNSGGAVGYDIKRVVVIVKWFDPRRNRDDFTLLDSYVSRVAPRI
jgi:prepilin-type N-terminal cleavage/methylation domain-containing protein